MMTEFQRGHRILARLKVQGNFIWSQENPELYLDAELFGLIRPPSTHTNLHFPSGNGQRGGNLEMWFWLVREGGRIDDIVIVITPIRNAIVGAVRDLAGNPVPGITINLSGPASRETATNEAGSFQFFDLAPGTYRVVALIDDQVIERTATVTPAIGGGLVLDPRNFPNARLEDVSGIGPVLRARLEARGIGHPAVVVSMEPQALAEVLGVRTAHAASLIENARTALQS